MGLFSKIRTWWFGRKAFSERETHFNRERLGHEMQKHAEALNELRGDLSHKVFADYVRSLLHMEILQLSTLPVTSLEAFARQKGKIEALRQVLDLREKFLQDKKEAKKSGRDEAVRSYVQSRTPANSAGLSV